MLTHDFDAYIATRLSPEEITQAKKEAREEYQTLVKSQTHPSQAITPNQDDA